MNSVRHDDLVSVVFPVFNEEHNLVPLYEQVRDAFQKAEVAYEMIFVDNGSEDGSLQTMKLLREKDSCVRYLSLSRNFGHQNALLAGLNVSRGDAVITMDADLQHPPTLITEMIRLWREGYDVVFTMKDNAGVTAWRRIQMRIFYRAISKLSGLELSFGQSDFRLMDHRVLRALLSVQEYRIFLRGMVKWLGFKQIGIPYHVVSRRSGTSKFSWRSLVSFALDGVLAFSVLPLRIVSVIGLLTGAVCFLYMGYVFVLGLLYLGGSAVDIPPGWATLAVAVMFLGAIQLVAVGVVGEYLARVFDQAKGRPRFIVRERSEED